MLQLREKYTTMGPIITCSLTENTDETVEGTLNLVNACQVLDRKKSHINFFIASEKPLSSNIIVLEEIHVNSNCYFHSVI